MKVSRSITLASLPLLLLAGGCNRMRFPQLAANYREYAYVANNAVGTVTVLDLVNFRADRTLQVGAQPSAIAVNPTRNEVYVTNSGSSTVTAINADNNSIAATIGVQRGPTGIDVDSTGKRAYVTNADSNSVSVIDLATHRSIATVAAGVQPATVRVSPDNRSLVVANRGAGSVSVYAIGEDHPLQLRSTYDKCSGAADIAILGDSSKAFITCPGNDEVMAVSLSSAPGTWEAKQDPASMQDHLLARLRVGKQPGHIALKPDSGEIFVSNYGSDSVSEISTYTNEVGGTYLIGTQPTRGIVGADNTSLWVAANGSDSVSLYSIDDGRMSNSIHTGPGPDAMAMSPGQPVLLVADSRGADVAVIRTRATRGPELFTMLPAGPHPVAIGIKAYKSH
ncbi:YncE family protein [Terriglobus sp. TAA 43]|uniref:YncE family protein n=1 Tax=Terriglobus sp. TAA 43 TaxID=278961 RepID=UPI001E454DE3|nr:YncE family protein [Terriglobus sp. TAA 43]